MFRRLRSVVREWPRAMRRPFSSPIDLAKDQGFPTQGLDEYLKAALWSDGQGVISHETALDLHGLREGEGAHRIDISVPTSYRIPRAGGGRYRVHQRDLDDIEVSIRDGVSIVTPARAIRDGIEIGMAAEQLARMIDDAEGRALVTGPEAQTLRREEEARRRLAR